MRNWKTTAAGVIASASAFVVFSPELFTHWPLVVALAKFAAAGGLATLGIVGSDAKKGGSQ